MPSKALLHVCGALADVPICTGFTAHAPLLQVTKLFELKERLVLVQPVAPCVKFGDPVLLMVRTSDGGVFAVSAAASPAALIIKRTTRKAASRAFIERAPTPPR